MSVVVDTGVFVSAADTDEPRHADCAGVLTGASAATVADIKDAIGRGDESPRTQNMPWRKVVVT